MHESPLLQDAAMVVIAYWWRCCLIVLLLSLVVSSAAATDQPGRYTNNQFGFSFQSPGGWIYAHAPERNVRVKIVAPDGSPAAECAVTVKEYPKAGNARQGEIDRIFLVAPTIEELHEVLADGGRQLKVIKASTGTLDTRPIHVARYRLQLGFDEFLFGQVAMTATPGLTWSVSCSGRGGSPEEAEKNYQFWQKGIEALMTSFRFTKKR
jgi:hypothetical protein